MNLARRCAGSGRGQAAGELPGRAALPAGGTRHAGRDAAVGIKRGLHPLWLRQCWRHRYLSTVTETAAEDTCPLINFLGSTAEEEAKAGISRLLWRQMFIQGCFCVHKTRHKRKGFYLVNALKSECFHYLRFYNVNPARIAGLELFIIWHSILCFHRRKRKRPGRFSQFVF